MGEKRKMIDRYLKISFVAALGAMALLYVIHNIMNMTDAYWAVGYVLSLENNEVFDANLLPAIPAAAIPFAAWIIFAFEIACGLICLIGAWKLWQARGADAAEFESAKTMAKIGAGLAVIIWFGFFGAIGGAGYQMWQSEIGAGSLGDAFKFSVWGLLVLIYLGQKDS
jgi:predicted small integral membrane protein